MLEQRDIIHIGLVAALAALSSRAASAKASVVALAAAFQNPKCPHINQVIKQRLGIHLLFIKNQKELTNLDLLM